MTSLIPSYVHALCTEIVKTSANTGPNLPAHTIFLGGGTPTLLEPIQLETILQTVHACFTVSPEAEITMEGNPGTLTAEKMAAYARAGINRLSLGVQSANEVELKLLGRIHDHQQTMESVEFARRADITNINLDLIYGLPGQSIKMWENTIQQVLLLHPTHLSLYALKIEEGTRLAQQVASGTLPEPDPDLAADMYLSASDILEQNGYAQYEISNWAYCADGKNYESRHNRQYWQNLPYFGFGAGSHALLSEQRLVNIDNIQAYINACEKEYPGYFPLSPATSEASPRSQAEAMDDQMIMGLRLTHDGVSRITFFDRFGIQIEERFSREIEKLLKLHLIEYTAENDSIRLTAQARLIGNQVFVHFLKD